TFNDLKSTKDNRLGVYHLVTRLRDVVGVSGLALEWFQLYLSNRNFSVFENQFMSYSKDLAYGVPQGSSPYHFYADDIQLYCSFKPMEVQKLFFLIKCLASIEQWLGDNYLQLNSEKSETFIIAPDSQIAIIKEHLGSLGSSVQLSLRYFGVIFLFRQVPRATLSSVN
uniref:Uncharacterized protein n=1 Tax=Haplochromis burtoni TaxID=8153 RepID=A0A3Q2X8G8_HAPBU